MSIAPPGFASPTYRPFPVLPTGLGSAFYDEVAPANFPKHELRFRNDTWAKRVGLDGLSPEAWLSHFARFEPLPSNLRVPLALRYHGHQFDSYNPRLGDGRGFLYAQLRDDQGRLLDLGTKGSGTTPWSRGGDGRLTLKGGIREVLATEMLEALGVYTSKTFSLFETGEKLLRGDEPSPTRSSVLVRLSHSHIRIGTFQRLAYLGEKENLDKLVAYSVEHYFPDLGQLSGDLRSQSFLDRVAENAAKLAASYMAAGFVHGVLNSDNMVITGESFDYGPYRFLPRYDPAFTAAYFDEVGLYAFGQQPRAILKNVLRLGEALRLLSPDLALGAAAKRFEEVLDAELSKRVTLRLGLMPQDDFDGDLVAAVFAFLETNGVGYAQFFFDHYGGRANPRAKGSEAIYASEHWKALDAILSCYEPAKTKLPDYFDDEGPCDLCIDEIEMIWSAISERDDFGPFEDKVRAIRRMGEALTPRVG
ncbi:MAG: YdiU family protein [Polyangiaceae bacterium]